MLPNMLDSGEGRAVCVSWCFVVPSFQCVGFRHFSRELAWDGDG